MKSTYIIIKGNVLLILLLRLTVIDVWAQDPTASFSLNNPYCIDESFTITNNSTNASDFAWDFCLGDFETDPSVASNLVSTTWLSANGMKIVSDGGNYYGFVTSFFTSELFRLEFGNSVENTPNVVNLGNLGMLNFPEGLDIMREGDDWIGVVSTGVSASPLIRLVWDTIDGVPVATSLGNFGLSERKFDVSLVKQDDDYVLVFPNYTGVLVRVNFGNSFRNTPAAGDIFISTTLPNITLPRGISVVRENNEWKVILVSLNGNSINVVDLGTDIFSTPNVIGNYPFPGLVQPTKLVVEEELGNYYAVVGNTSARATLIDLKTLSATDTPEEIGITNAPVLNGIDFVQIGSDSYVLGTKTNLNRLIFANVCPVSTDFSTQENPQVSYSAAGNFDIGLTAISSSELEDEIVQSVTIANSRAPDIDLTNQTICLSAPIEFQSINVSGDITNYSWDFGDSNTSTDENPSHTYATSGDFDVILNVTSSEGCVNTIQKTITVFDEPIPSFDLPIGPICTNQPVFIQNTTLGDFGGNITYEWQLNGQPQATTTNLENLTFITTGPQEIKLIATIPGCSVEIIQNITNVSEGPTPAFNVNDDCVGTLMQFNNTSFGQISSQSWDFGNGFTSTLENPAFEYSVPGTYEVTLTLTNADGCVVEMSEFVTVYELPQVRFTNELSCEQSPTQFIDQTTVGDANIVSWSWNFDDDQSTNNTSIARDPQHSFSTSGDFDVKLITTSTFGCIDSVEQSVTVLQAPQVDFSFDQVCIGEPIQFQDLSLAPTGGSITSWAWDLGGVFSDEQNPQFTFDVAADYRIGLIVTSDNLCSFSMEKIITVAPAPDVRFDQEFACNNEPVHFFDLTEITNDDITEWNWDFDGLGTSADSSTFFMFPSEGTYEVQLRIVTGNGCDYTTTQTVVVNESPQASFSTDFSLGSPPLTVQFSNTSQGATSFFWDFQNGATSIEENPTEVFEDLGDYDVSLVVTDDNVCRDTARQRISVLFPELEVELQRISIIPDNVSSRIILTLSNNGTIFLDSLSASIDLGNEVIINETIRRSIPPGETINHTLDLSIGRSSLSYICVTLESFLPNIVDANFSNNDKCGGFDQSAVILPPSSNPVTGQFILSVITDQARSLNVQLISSQGDLTKNITVDLNDGFNNVLIDVTDVNSGMYILTSDIGSTSDAVRLMILN